MTKGARTPAQPSRSYAGRGVKGGTVIAEDVLDIDKHRRLLRHPDDYRLYVSPCPRCGNSRMQTHCFRQRQLRPGDPGRPPVCATVRLYRCASRSCRAVFTVLPAFIARHLWRSWETVENVVNGTEAAPARTRRRWLSRLKSNACELFQTFTSMVKGRVTELLCKAQPRSRLRFVEVLEQVVGAPRLALTAAWLHRLRPGVRLLQPTEVRVGSRDNQHPLPDSIRCGRTASLGVTSASRPRSSTPQAVGAFRSPYRDKRERSGLDTALSVEQRPPQDQQDTGRLPGTVVGTPPFPSSP